MVAFGLVLSLVLVLVGCVWQGLEIEAMLKYLDVSWRRSLPLADEVRSLEVSSMLDSRVEIPIIPTQAMDLRRLERARQVLEVKVSDAGSRMLAKAIESRRQNTLVAVTSPCSNERSKHCNPRSAEALNGVETLVLRVEKIRWSHGSSVILSARFLERGLLYGIRTPPSEELKPRIFFGVLAQFSVGELIQRRRDSKRGLVLSVQWSDSPKAANGHSRKKRSSLIDETSMDLVAMALNKFFGPLFDEKTKIQPPPKRHALSRASYLVMTESSKDDQPILQRWSHDAVYAWPRPPFLVPQSSPGVHLIPNPTPQTRSNTDRDYVLGNGWSALLRDCPRHACYFLQAPHKSHGYKLARLLLYAPADIFLAVSVSAPQPFRDDTHPLHFTLYKSQFAYHGCCPPSPLRLYRAHNVTPGTYTLHNHALLAQGSQAHTYIYMIRIHAPRALLAAAEEPFRHKYLDTFFLDFQRDSLLESAKERKERRLNLNHRRSPSFLKKISFSSFFPSVASSSSSSSSLYFEARSIPFRDMVPILDNVSSERNDLSLL